jgi:hypothetical protein
MSKSSTDLALTFSTPILRTRDTVADGIIREGDAPPGCCVIVALTGRCGMPGKQRAIACPHEHVMIGEVCDNCARFVAQITCGHCRKSREPHVCRLSVMDVPP